MYKGRWQLLTCGKHNYISIRIQYEELMNWGMLNVGLQENVKPLGATYRGEVHIFLQVFLHRLYWAHKKRQVRSLKKAYLMVQTWRRTAAMEREAENQPGTSFYLPYGAKALICRLGKATDIVTFRYWHKLLAAGGWKQEKFLSPEGRGRSMS